MIKTWKSYLACVLAMCICNSLFSQETNCDFSGRVISADHQNLSHATVTLTHEPTQSVLSTISDSNGYFNFFNIKPGGPYSLKILHSGYESITTSNLYFNLLSEKPANGKETVFILNQKSELLEGITVKSTKLEPGREGPGIHISDAYLQSLPSIARNFQDYLRLIPQAVITRDGGISLAGQNNRSNAFFIDGVNNNDILGLAASGTNGGQTGSPPISMEAIEQVSVVIAPYDVQYSNFTGGSINAITRSGSNQFKASAWYYFRNEKLAGRSPDPVEKPGVINVFEYPRLSHFSNYTIGVRAGGAIKKNKIFYFVLAESQIEYRPQPFNLADYRGNATALSLAALSDFIKSHYQYDPGSFTESKDILHAQRFLGRLDWNPSDKNKFTLSFRYNNAERTSLSNASGSTLINFSNFAGKFPAESFSTAFEWKSFYKNGATNRVLISMLNEAEDKSWEGKPFPRVNIADGTGSITFGSLPSAVLSLYKGTNVSLTDVFKFTKNNHSFAAGAEASYTGIQDSQINNFFGTYQFKSIEDFLAGGAPIRYQRSFSLLDNPKDDRTLAAANFHSFHTGLYFNDNIHLKNHFSINMGLRVDLYNLPSHTITDRFFNDSAKAIILKYYDLEGATAGILVKPPLQLSPRFGFVYVIPKDNIVVQGGAGIFSGRMLNISADVLYVRNGVSTGNLDIIPQLYGLNFNPDPYNQPSSLSLGINPADAKGELDIIAKKIRNPSVFKTSLMVSKKISPSWTLSAEGIVTRNISEFKYTNVNLLPPVKKTDELHPRDVYATINAPSLIPLRVNGTNPYTGQIFLLSNNHGKKGSSYSTSFIVNKTWTKNLSLYASYTFGKSTVLFEPSFNNTIYNTQWRGLETVNGKNNASLSESDLSIGHRVTASMIKTFFYKKKNTSTTLSLFYNGQSGTPYSYVYNGSIVNDDGIKQNYDLIFIPTAADLLIMNFTPVTNSAGMVIYSPDYQRQLLDQFIQSDRYLRKNRGKFAERNGARLPFSNIIDCRLQQDFNLKISGRKYGIILNYDVFNILNMISRNWGRIYYLPGESYPLIKFAGYANNSLKPLYQFTPVAGNIYSLQPSTAPGYSARWISQLGIKISFE